MGPCAVPRFGAPLGALYFLPSVGESIMFGVSKAHWQVAGVALAAFAVLVFVQSPHGLNFKLPVVGPYLPGGQ